MSESVAGFVSELIRAANEIDRVALFERAGLLRRAAAKIGDFHGSAKPDYRGSPDLVENLSEMADTIGLHPSTDVSATLLDPVAAIKAARVRLQQEQDADYQALIADLNRPEG